MLKAACLLTALLVVAPAAAQEALPPPNPYGELPPPPPPPPPYEPPGQPQPARSPPPRSDAAGSPYSQPRARPASPNAQEPYAQQPYAQQPYNQQPYAQPPLGQPGVLVPKPPRRFVPGLIGEGSQAPAGSQAAPLHPDERLANWRFSLASGVIGRWGGMQLSSTNENSSVMLYFGGQADGLWTEGFGHSARLRLRMMTGGEDLVYLPSEGEVEAAYMIGRRELRFVVGRLEVGRYPGLGLQLFAQFATLPCFEGSLSLSGDRMRLYYYISPVEATYVYYYGDAHVPNSHDWPTESDRVQPASAFRLRYSVMVPPSVLLSLQGDFVKTWGKPDLLVSGEGSAGYAVLDQSVLLDVVLRWDNVTRRGVMQGTEAKSSQVMLMAVATLSF